MPMFHTTERLGAVQSTTAEGFLICEGVPVSRTGTLLYAPGELPIPPGPDGLIRVERSDDAVFHHDAMRSFEGKSLVDLHPGEDVTPYNWRRYAVGHMQNVRRGEGEQSHVMLADLVVKDAAAIAAVRAGKRHVSLGYQAQYQVTAPGHATQTNIIGNHVALVPEGRCGPTCSIGDEAMTTATQRTWMDRIRSAFTAQDEVMLASALAEAPVGTTGTPGQAIHIHTGDKGGVEPRAAAGDKDFAAMTADAIAGLNTAMKELGATVADLSGKMAAIDARVGDMASKEASEKAEAAAAEKEKADAEANAAKAAEVAETAKADAEQAAAKTGDSAALASVWQDTLSRAETLMPGVALPTFDAKAPPAVTEEALCGFRRRVLTAASTTGSAHVAALVKPGTDLAAMTCDAVGFVFQGATELAKHANNGAAAAGHRVTAAGPTRAPTPAEINAKNKSFYQV